MSNPFSRFQWVQIVVMVVGVIVALSGWVYAYAGQSAQVSANTTAIESIQQTLQRNTELLIRIDERVAAQAKRSEP